MNEAACSGLVVATPAHGGFLLSQFGQMLDATKHYLMSKWGLQVIDMVAPSDSAISRSRNVMVHKFLTQTRASHFLFIDADIEWKPQAVERLIASGFDVCCGVYPFKSFPPEFVFHREPTGDGSMFRDARTGYLRIWNAPTGFLMLTRRGLERMVSAYPETRHRMSDRETGETIELSALFDFKVEDGQYWSEDYLFCRRWRAIGGEVWMDPEIHLKHWGLHGFDAGRPADHIIGNAQAHSNVDGATCQRGGLLWPATDRISYDIILNEAETEIPRLLELVPTRGVVIQAGGHCGVWPLRLSLHFQRVYTFEPNRLNFGCLASNTLHRQNVACFNAALSDDRRSCGMVNPQGNANAGSWQITDGEGVTSVRGDDVVPIGEVSLIQLDVEGHEHAALSGLASTIEWSRPVIMVEAHGHGDDDAVRRLLSQWGYRHAGRLNDDEIWKAAA